MARRYSRDLAESRTSRLVAVLDLSGWHREDLSELSMGVILDLPLKGGGGDRLSG